MLSMQSFGELYNSVRYSIMERTEREFRLGNRTLLERDRRRVTRLPLSLESCYCTPYGD
jgi:hypothetical protein